MTPLTSLRLRSPSWELQATGYTTCHPGPSPPAAFWSLWGLLVPTASCIPAGPRDGGDLWVWLGCGAQVSWEVEFDFGLDTRLAFLPMAQ